MASVPGSGEISSENLVSVFGGSAPQSSDQYYRDGGRVPGTSAGTPGYWSYGNWSAYHYNSLYPQTYAEDQSPSGWRATWAADPFFSIAAPPLATTMGGYQYQAGAYQETVGGKPRYSLRRRTATYIPGTPGSPINQGVPTSGEMSSDDFYGAETA